jgi:formylglycine-generating enzyme required for sulfatase activity
MCGQEDSVASKSPPKKPSRAELEVELAALKVQLAAAQVGTSLSIKGDANQIADRSGIVASSVMGSFFMTGGTLQGDVYVGEPTTDSREALDIYRRVLISRYSQVHLQGIVPPSDAKARESRPNLAQVYVALNTKSFDQVAVEQGQLDLFWDSTPLSALAAASRNRRLILLGDPGSGKSTFIAHLGLCLAAHSLFPKGGWLDSLPGWPKAESKLVPLPVVLRDFARSSSLKESSRQPNAKQLWDFLVDQFARQNISFACRAIERSLERGAALLILDGLDEIPGVEDRRRVRDAVEAFSSRYPRCRLIATCRTLSYQSPGSAVLEDVPVFELAPFDEDQIDRFIHAWYAELGRLGAVRSEDVLSETRALREAVRRPDIRRLAPNPLLLAVMAAFHAHRGRLPDQRAQLYEETVNLLLWNWEQAQASCQGEEPVLRQLLLDAGKTDADLYRTLARRAFLVHLQDSGEDDEPADIAEKDLEKDLAGLHPERSKDWATKVIEAIRLRAGLLVERTEGVFAFPHRTFQEYLAGAHLAALGNFTTEALALAKRDLPLSREILLLAAGKQVHVNREVDRPLHLVGVLCPPKMVNDEQLWRRVILAGEILVEIGVDAARTGAGGEDLCQRVRNRLVALIEGEILPARERSSAGDVLAAIGDPRFQGRTEGYLPADDMMGFLEIPSGRFLMRSETSRDRQVGKNEEPQHRIDLPGFLIARFPVTTGQFGAFVKETGTNLLDEDGLRKPATRPMTRVSLAEALAYCAWLDGKLRLRAGLPAKLGNLFDRGGKVTLPSESEWEKAALGTKGWTYPWGNDWNNSRANTREAGIGSTSAVGCFGSGRSPYGCEEMSGNVWEWTRSPYLLPTSGTKARPEDPSSNCFRVARGASYFSSNRLARADFRNNFGSLIRHDDLGFRVVVSPLLSDF